MAPVESCASLRRLCLEKTLTFPRIVSFDSASATLYTPASNNNSSGFNYNDSGFGNNSDSGFCHNSSAFSNNINNTQAAAPSSQGYKHSSSFADDSFNFTTSTPKKFNSNNFSSSSSSSLSGGIMDTDFNSKMMDQYKQFRQIKGKRF